MSAPSSVLEGYMLKKKRKKMQGFARRYFTLTSNGTLYYSINPSTPVRDSIVVSLAFVTASRKRRTFHVDSGTTVMHCKALSLADFDKWAESLKSFVGTVGEAGSVRSRKRGVGTSGDNDSSLPPSVDMPVVLTAISKMAAPLQELEGLLADLKLNDNQSSSPSHQALNGNAAAPSPKFKFLKNSKHGKDAGKAEDYFDSRASGGDHLSKIYQALNSIKSQHSALTSAVTVSSIRSDESTPPRYASRGTSHMVPKSSSSRASSFSMASEDTDESYEDALPGEFMLEDEDSSEDDTSTGRLRGLSFATMNEEKEEEQIQEDEEGNDDEEEVVAETHVRQMPQSNDSVSRRSKLPCPVSGDEFSMLGMLRKNVGKDLSTISFPVTMNEPLSALQRIAEELEYCDLLNRAAKSKSSIERLVLVATFAISGSSGNKFRSSRKPFNPLLGETYECVRPDKGFRFISEKVSHHPPIMAFHADGDLWTMEGHLTPSQKFWGRSMEVFVSGSLLITFRETGDIYSIKKPSSFVRNLVAGTKYLEVVGDMIVSHEKSGEKAVISFKEGSAWGGNSSRNKIEGKVLDSNGKSAAELVGRWDEHVDRKEGKDNFQRLWEINDFQKFPEQFFGFSDFALQLNETTSIEKDLLAKSDSRLRPDQVALECGKVESAEEIKKRVEEKQREKRKALVEEGKDPAQPIYFEKNGDTWKYGGQYFSQREKRTLIDPDIF